MQILLTFLLLICSYVSVAAQQGQLVFNNRIAGSVDAPVDFMGDAPTGMKAQLYLVDGAGNLRALEPSTTFRTGNPRSVKYVNGIDVIVPGVSPGHPVTVRMVAYNGADFESSSFRGYSEELTIPSIGGGTLPPSSLVGLKGFSILPGAEATLLAVKGSPGTLWAGPGSTGGSTSGTSGSTTGGTDGTATTGGTDGSSTNGGTTGITTGSTDGSSSAGTTGSTDGSTTGTIPPDIAPEVIAPDTLWQIAIVSGPYAQTNYPVLFSGGAAGTFQNGNWSGQYTYSKTAPDTATLTLTYINSAGLSSEEMKVAFATTSTGTILASQTFSANGTATLYENVNATLVDMTVVGTTGGTTGSVTTGGTTAGTDGSTTGGSTTAGTNGGTTGGQKAQIYFNNRVPPEIDAPVDFMGADPIGMKAQVFWLGPAGAFIPLVPTTTFRTNNPLAARYVVPIDIILGNIAPLTFITLRVVAFSGDDFESSQYRGYSDEFSISEVGGGVMPPSNLVGLTGFSIVPAAEATMVAVKGSPRTLFDGPGSTGGDPGTTTGGTDGGSTGVTTGNTDGTTTGTLPGFAPTQISTNTRFGLLVTGGAFVNSASLVKLSGGNAGTFYLDEANTPAGTYTYSRITTNAGSLTLDFGSGTRGGKDVMQIVFTSASEAVFTGVQSIDVGGGTIVQRTDLAGKIYNWYPNSAGTTGGTTGNSDGGTTSTTGNTDGGTTGSTTGSNLPTSAPTEIAPGSTIRVIVDGGPFAGFIYEVTLSGGSIGTFLISAGASGNGTYTYYRQSDSGAILTLDYSSPVSGERDTMQMTFGLTGTISFLGAQKIGVGAGGFIYRNDFYGRVMSWSGSGGTTGGTDGGTISTTGGVTTGSLPTAAPGDITPNTVIRFAVEGGAFSGSLYDVIFTGGSSGNFTIIAGASAHGTYTYLHQSNTSATLTLNYASPVQGERDTMNIVFGSSTLLRFTGSQNVDTGNGTFIERTDFSGRIKEWYVGSPGTTGGTDGGTIGGTIGGLDSGTTAGTTGGVTGGTTTHTNGGTTAQTDGGTTATSTGGTTSGSGTSGGTLEIPSNASLKVIVTGGAYAGASYDIILSGGNIGTFTISAGASGNGNYTFTSYGSYSGQLTLNYLNPVGGEIDILNFILTSQSVGTFSGSQRLDGGGGVFYERSDFAGQLTNVSGFQVILHGGTTGSTTAGGTAGTIGGTTAGTTGGVTGGTDGSTTATDTGETTAGTTAGVTSGTTAGTTSGSTAGTTAGTTDGTTGASTTGGDSGSTSGNPGGTTGTTTVSTTFTLILKPGFNLIANHVFTEDNTVSNLFRSLPDGSMIHKYDGSTFAIATKNGEFAPTSAAQMLVQPGEGVFVMNPTSSDITIPIQGQIPEGASSNLLPAGLSIRSSRVPRAGTPVELGIPMQDGDQIFTFDPATQKYKTWTFDTLEGMPGQFLPAPGPNLKVGEAFYLRKGVPAVWTQTFQVTP